MKTLGKYVTLTSDSLFSISIVHRHELAFTRVALDWIHVVRIAAVVNTTHNPVVQFGVAVFHINLITKPSVDCEKLRYEINVLFTHSSSLLLAFQRLMYN